MATGRNLRAFFVKLAFLWSVSLVCRCEAQSQFWIRLGDNTPSGTQVGALVNHPILRNFSQFSDSVKLNRTYGIIPISSDGAQYFRVDSASGAIYTARPVDRDDLCVDSRLCCDNELVCTFSFRALAVVGKSQLVPLVHVSVTDQNDNAPRFAAPSVALEVLESTEPRGAYRSFEMRLPPATDLDSKNYSIRDYRLLTTDGSKFSLRKPTSLTDPSEMLVLLIREPLDREETDRYQMTVVAYDGGQPSLSSSMVVVIHVRDANDHQPVFLNKTYSVSVPESFPVGEVILQLNATDKDDGENGRVVYEFDQSVSDDIRRRFILDSNTGTLRLYTPFDYETHRSYRFIILAHDAVEPAKFDKAIVSITVTDINDEYPVIDISPIDESSQTSEAARPGTIVMYMKVSDKEGFNGNCSLDNPRFALELLESNRQPGSKGFEYNVVTRLPLDREINEVEIIGVHCYDSMGDQALDATRQVNLTVADVNDNAPSFQRAALDVVVAENNSPDEPIVQLLADDADDGVNSELRFQLASGNTAFRVDSESGQIFSLKPLDREERARYLLPVTVHDLGNPPLLATATVTITVSDQNDNPPAFSASSYEFTAAEHERLGTYVGQVRVTDADDVKLGNGAVSFSIPASSGAPFTIDPRDGIIFTDQELNREARDLYVFEVLASDHGNPPLSTSVQVTVRVSDKNDHAPQVRYPVGANASLFVACTEQLYHPIVTINASDDDLDRNRALRFALLTGDRNLFSVDADSGTLRLNRALAERDCGRRENVTIEVRDGGSPSLRAEAKLLIVFDSTVRPSVTVSAPAPSSRRPGVAKQHDEGAGMQGDSLDPTIETMLLVVVFGVLIAMLVVTFAVIFISKRNNIAASVCTFCCASAEEIEADDDKRSADRVRRTRHQHHHQRKRHEEHDRQSSTRGRDSESVESDERAAAFVALLNSEEAEAEHPAVFNADRTCGRSLSASIGNSEQLDEDQNNNNNNNNNNNTSGSSKSRSKRRRARVPDCGSVQPPSEKYECFRVMEVDELKQSDTAAQNYYLPADRLNMLPMLPMLHRNAFANTDGGNTPIRLIPLDAARDAFVLCNPDSVNYGVCPNAASMPHAEASRSGTLHGRRTMIASPVRYAPPHAAICGDYTAMSRSKSAASTAKAFPQIESSMI